LEEIEVNVIGVPAHEGFADGETDIPGDKTGLKLIVIAFEVAGFPVGQVTFE
jgi:hypothetical protein